MDLFIDDDLDEGDISTSEYTESPTIFGARRPQAYAYEPICASPLLRGKDLESESSNQEVQSGNNCKKATKTSSRVLDLSWCVCSNCVIMPTSQECVCCHEFGIDLLLDDVVQEGSDGTCITNHKLFSSVALERDILEISLLTVADTRAINAVRPITASLYRLTAYRQFILWTKGYLGKGNRTPIPSCAIRKIRDVYPSHDGTYKGFELSALQSTYDVL